MEFLFSLTFCILVTGFIRVNGEGLPTLEDPARDCKNASVMKERVNEAKCMPRKTLVKLFAKPGYDYPLNMVLVDRCDGQCFSISCIPKSTVLKPIVMLREHIISGAQECAIEFVEEHTKCRCGCDIKEEDCNKVNQRYDSDNCLCQCINDERKNECEKHNEMRWDSETCKCVCDKPEEVCSTGLYWVPAYCRCMRVVSANDNRN